MIPEEPTYEYVEALVAERDSLRNQRDQANEAMSEVSLANITLTEQRNMAQSEARVYAEDVAKAQIRARAAEARAEAAEQALQRVATGNFVTVGDCQQIARAALAAWDKA